MSIQEKLLQAVDRYRLLEQGDRVLCAVSGGQDSVALACLLTDLAREWRLSLVLGHLHHGLRAQGDVDQAFVAAMAENLGWPFVAERVDVAALAEREGVGLEVAGRQARHDFLNRAADAHGCSRIALGHTATDRAETLLMNLFRGAGSYGLRAIPPCRGRLIRPLILASRQETGELCRSRDLRVCLDESNLDPRHLRNRVRNELWPDLEGIFGEGLEEPLGRAADAVAMELEWTEPLAQETLDGIMQDGGLSVPALREFPEGLRFRVLRAFLERSGHPLTDISAERWAALEAFVRQGETGKRLELSGGWSVLLEYGRLHLAGGESPAVCLSARVEPAAVWAEVIELAVPGQATLPDGRTVGAVLTSQRPELPAAEAPMAVLDAAAAGGRLELRLPRRGDRFQPLGLEHTKKLQDFFVDEKVPRRNRCPLLVVGERGRILWVVGHRISELARARGDSKEYIVLRVSQGADAQS